MKLTPKGPALLLPIKVVPNASRNQIVGPYGDALKIKVAQPPEDGKANAAVLELLAQTLQIPASQLTLATGHSRPQKIIAIHGLSEELIRQRLSL